MTGSLVSPVGTVAAATSPAAAQPQGQIELAELTGLGSGSHTVTLITGDTVKLTKVGGKYAVDPVPAIRPDGTRPQLLTAATPDAVYVIPSDAKPAVDAGRLDRELFNVSYLAENGYTDDKTKQLPVIVQYPQQSTDKAVAAAAEALPASKSAAILESINGAAVQVAKGDAEEFWTAVRAVPDKSTAAGADGVVGLGDVSGTLRAGISKIWLDSKVHAILDESVPMIGAPAAWSGGYDGAGIKVAVLDTGIDAGHPDLAGRVVASQSFIAGEEVQDGHGHGTHVASTVVGSGAASDGKYKGVAPGAQLIVGKVLGNGASGTASSVLNGMEWAASSGAKVISMSLGGGPSDGSDPLSQAVHFLTRDTGALFVIAAGNDGGSGPGTVTSPGTADAALTVAAVTKADQWAEFSSQGPRFGDGALKPDIAAPGVDIAAASANNDDNAICRSRPAACPGDGYMRISGTSMATPHVAGAVAILAQQHPDWTAAQLKAALMSTAKDDQLSAYKQGAGRVDVARAFRQQVFATTANLDYGTVTEPGQTLTRELTYTNLGDQPVTLDLTPVLQASDGSAVEGALGLADTTLTVPAGGIATTAVSLDTTKLPDVDDYSGAVTATADGVQLRSPVGVVRDVPRVKLTVHTLGRDGQPADPWGQGNLDVSGDRGYIWPTYLTAPGTTETRVPLGSTISVTQLMSWIDEGDLYNTAVLSRPELTITGDTEITLDARDASEITFTTPKPAERLDNDWVVGWQRTTANGTPYMYAVTGSLAATERAWASPTEPVTIGKFRFHSRFTLGQAPVAMTVRKPGKATLHPVMPHRWSNATPDMVEYVPFTGTQTLDVVDVGQGRPEDLAGRDLDGKLALLQAVSPAGPCYVNDRVMVAIREAGAAGVAYYPSPGSGCALHQMLVWIPKLNDPPLVTHISHVALPTREGLALRDQLKDGRVEVQVTGTPETPYTYTLAPYEEGRIPGSLHYTYTDRDLAQVDMDVHLAQGRRYHDFWWRYKNDDVTGLVTDPMTSFPWLTRTSRRDWVGPLDPDVLTLHGMAEIIPAEPTPEDPDGLRNQTNRYRLDVFDEPTRTRQTWLATPLTPGAPTGSDKVYELARPGPNMLDHVFDCSVCVRGDALWAGFHLSNGKPGSRFFTWDGGAVSWKPGTLEPSLDIRLFRDGAEIPRVPGLEEVPLFTPPEGEGEYRLTATNDQHDVEWTFTSAVDTKMLEGSNCVLENLYGTSERCRPLPVVFVSYDLGDALAIDNTVPAGRSHSFTVSPYHQPSQTEMPAIAGLKLWASTDDGETYTPVSVRRNGDGTYTANAMYPALGETTGAVTLKVEAWDTEGNTIKQTTKRAFNLRASTPDLQFGPQ